MNSPRHEEDSDRHERQQEHTISVLRERHELQRLGEGADGVHGQRPLFAGISDGAKRIKQIVDELKEYFEKRDSDFRAE